MSRLDKALASLSLAFASIGVRWYVFGAQAAIFHGVTRATADIDVTVDPAGRTTAEIAAGLGKHGFRLRIEDHAFVEQTRVLPAVHETGVPVDVVLAGPGIEELFFERAVERTIATRSVPIASAEDIIVMKVLAGRPKDLDDIEAIVQVKRDLDVEVVRETLRMLEQALDQSDLIPIFERIWARARR